MQDNGRRDAYEVENMVEEDETFEQHRASIKFYQCYFYLPIQHISLFPMVHKNKNESSWVIKGLLAAFRAPCFQKPPSF